MRIISGLVATALLLTTTACGDNQQAQQQIDDCLQAANPQECMQVRDAGGSVKEYLIGGLAGFVIAKMMTPSGPRSYIAEDPNWHGPRRKVTSYYNSRTYVSRPNYRPYSARHGINISQAPKVRQTTVTKTTTTKKGLFGGTKTTTTTTVKKSSSAGWGSSSSNRTWKSSSSSSSRSFTSRSSRRK